MKSKTKTLHQEQQAKNHATSEVIKPQQKTQSSLKPTLIFRMEMTGTRKKLPIADELKSRFRHPSSQKISSTPMRFVFWFTGVHSFSF
jgi:hypothetical protein